ncbi:MAG: 50S ribosomal protein L6 [Candidatus Margulisiibacteriota bacterium]
MSRLGKKPIVIPKEVTFSVQDRNVTIKGPKGTLTFNMDALVSAEQVESEIHVKAVNDSKEAKAMFGLTRAILFNYVTGVSEGFSKELELVGVGYRVQLQGQDLIFSLGYSHPIKVEPPQTIQFQVEGQNKVIVTGPNKELVGQVASDIRALRPPNPYKGKGVKLSTEVIRRKQGKSVKK